MSFLRSEAPRRYLQSEGRKTLPAISDDEASVGMGEVEVEVASLVREALIAFGTVHRCAAAGASTTRAHRAPKIGGGASIDPVHTAQSSVLRPGRGLRGRAAGYEDALAMRTAVRSGGAQETSSGFIRSCEV